MMRAGRYDRPDQGLRANLIDIGIAIAVGFGVGLAFLLAVDRAARAGFDEGLAAYERGDYAVARAEWRPAAEQGDVRAQLRLGELYRDGKGVWRNGDDAALWFRMAALQGNTAAQYYLARLHFEGFIVPRDTAEMMHWLSAAADAGYWRAQVTLGAVYEFGFDDLPADLSEALKCYELAASHGAPEVQAMAERLRERVRAKMTAGQIAEALVRVQAWRPEAE
jgi:uncharacterized protein